MSFSSLLAERALTLCPATCRGSQSITSCCDVVETGIIGDMFVSTGPPEENVVVFNQHPYEGGALSSSLVVLMSGTYLVNLSLQRYDAVGDAVRLGILNGMDPPINLLVLRSNYASGIHNGSIVVPLYTGQTIVVYSDVDFDGNVDATLTFVRLGNTDLVPDGPL